MASIPEPRTVSLFGEDYEAVSLDSRLPVEDLSKTEQKVINYIVQYWFTQRGLPMPQLIAEHLKLDRTKVAMALSNKAVIYALEDQGITYADKGVLTEIQLAAANTLFDFNDRRSDTKKLADLGVSAATYAGWKRLPVFADYLQQRAENLFGDSHDEAVRSLIYNVRKGDMNGIKLYFEMTGRWSSKTAGEVNIEFLLIKIIEVLQIELSDQPERLTAIANKLQGLAGQAAGGSITAPPASLKELGP